jgi:hypothetical protein
MIVTVTESARFRLRAEDETDFPQKEFQYVLVRNVKEPQKRTGVS